MDAVQSTYRPANFQYQFSEITAEQKKAWYEALYDAEGNIKPPKGIEVQDVPGWDGKSFEMRGYAIEKVGDGYVVFAMNPAINFGSGKDLTKEQLAYLRTNYNLENLSKEDRIKLLAELSCFGVISGQQAYGKMLLATRAFAAP